MLPRALEVLLVALLVVLTVTAVFSFMNHQHQLENQRLLREMVGELKTQRESTQALSQVIAALEAKATDSVDSPRGIAVNAQPPTPAPPAAAPATQPVAAAVPTEPKVPAPAPPAGTSPTTTAVAPAPEPAVPSLPASPPQPAVAEVAASPAPTPTASPPSPASDAGLSKPPDPTPPPAVPDTPSAPGSTAGAGSKAYEGNWERDGPVVREVIEQLLGGRYQTVVRRFDRTLASELPQADLAAVIDPLRFKHLGMKKIQGHQAVPHNLGANTHVYEVAAEMSDGHRLVFTVTLDHRQRITGLIMK